MQFGYVDQGPEPFDRSFLRVHERLIQRAGEFVRDALQRRQEEGGLAIEVKIDAKRRIDCCLSVSSRLGCSRISIAISP